MRATAVFRLLLTKPPQWHRATGALPDNATKISLAASGFRASVFDPPPQDQPSQALVSGTTHRGSATVTIHGDGRIRCIRAALETWGKWSVHVWEAHAVPECCRVRCPQWISRYAQESALRQRTLQSVCSLC